MRAAASFLFLAGLCAVLFWAVRTAHGDEIREIDPEVRIAAKHEAAAVKSEVETSTSQTAGN